MLFRKLAEYLQELENVPGRIEMTKILARLFTELDKKDIKLATYLIQGNLGPAFMAPDFGLADKQVIKAIKRLSDKDVEEIFKKVGDLGLVVERIKSENPNSKTQITSQLLNIKHVYERLLEIANEGGTGSQERKQQLVYDLLNELDATSAKYVTRIILSKLRVGFSEMTMIDALSWMLTGDKSLREKIESIYNVRADLGQVAELTKNHGLKTIDLSVEPELGTPVIMAKCERAEDAQDIWDRNGECALEDKLDGLRIQAHISKSQVKLFSRGLEDVTAMYPDIARGLQGAIADDCIVEGEMIAVSGDGKTLEFKKTMNRKRKHGIAEKAEEIPMCIFLFDILFLNGKNLIPQENSLRWSILQDLIGVGNKNVNLIKREIAKSCSEINTYFKDALHRGNEGVVAKKLDSPYTPGSRDFAWMKMKSVLDSVDVVVMGYSHGEGKRSDFGIGEFLVGIYDAATDRFLTVSKVGSGATDKEWQKLEGQLSQLKVDTKPERYVVEKQYEPDYWVHPKVVLEIVANEISESPAHSSGYGLRFPRLLAWREKRPEDATSLREIISMYSLSKK